MKTSTIILIALGALAMLLLFKQSNAQRTPVLPAGAAAPSNFWGFLSSGVTAGAQAAASIFSARNAGTKSTVGTQADGSFDISGSRATPESDGITIGAGDDNSIDA